MIYIHFLVTKQILPKRHKKWLGSEVDMGNNKK